MKQKEEDQSATCASCKYFYRHYVKIGNHRYNPLNVGHCTDPRCRDKKVDTPACHRFSASNRI